MAQPVRVVVKGLGTVGKQFTQESLKRGVQIVGAVDGWDELHVTARLSQTEGETETTRWQITGYPNLTLSIDDYHGDISTTSAIINRLVDVMGAEPGFLTVNDLPVPFFRGKPLGEYRRN